MIPVTPQPEPATFEAKVRSKGLAHLAKKGIELDQPLPSGTELAPYWRDCLSDLYQAYSGVCAYLGIHFERITGAASTDHFVAKSADARQAYEWSNFRLACSTMNSRKGTYSTVMDPFDVQNDWFYLELVTGHMYANPALDAQTHDAVENTIKTLKLDDADCREVRVRHFDGYIQGEYVAQYLKRISPFVWYEANRQGLL